MIKGKKTIAIALFLMTTIVASMMMIPSVQARDITSNLLLSVNPNPIGVGQVVYINLFFAQPMPTSTGLPGDRHENVTVEVTRPDGTKETFGPYMADSVGGIYLSYTPATTGNYTIQAFYPGQILTGTNPLKRSTEGAGALELIGSYMKPSTSEKVTLLVQDEQVVPIYKTPPLPTEYWSRPIYSTNYEWAQLGGNWYGDSNVQMYTTAPNTGHILWTKPTHFGGQPGAPNDADQQSQYMSTSLLITYFNPRILNGIIYYNQYASSTSTVTGWAAVDMRTGETLWTRTAGETGAESIVRVQALQWHSIQEYGAIPYLWSQEGGASFFGPSTPMNYRLYDPITGKYLAVIENASSALDLRDYDCNEKGTFLGWYTTFNATGAYLNLWNSTQCIAYNLGRGPFYMPGNVPYQSTFRAQGEYDFSKGIMWTVPLEPGVPSSIAAKTSEVILLRNAPTPGMFIGLSYGYQTTAGYNAKTGQKLWGPINQTIPTDEAIGVTCYSNDVYVTTSKTSCQAWGYSLKTGQLLWGPVSLPGNAWSHMAYTGACGYGMAYIVDFGGFVNALDLETGEIKWTFTRGSAGYDTPFGVYPIWYFSYGSICDGKVFLSEGHEYNPPLFPSKQLAINATTGELVWSILFAGIKVVTAHADSMITTWNCFDNQIYTFGKGQTATTVSIQDDVITNGDSVLITGSVTDESPGTKDSDRIARFPHGVPAIADEYMSPWMEYVYMQQTYPADAVGVEVVLSVLDPNNNYYEVGRTTSDASGGYKLMFTPEVPGEYTVIASFAGSESYWKSTAQTYLGVLDAPEATPEPTQAPASLADQYMLPGIGIIVAAIAAVGIAIIALMLRKK